MTDPANPNNDGPLPGNPPAAAAVAAAVARHPGHELPFVQPSTYLHLRAPTASATANSATAPGTFEPLLASPAASRSSSSAAHHNHSYTIPPPAAPTPKPLMTPLDRDQVQGLVSSAAPVLGLTSDRDIQILRPGRLHPTAPSVPPSSYVCSTIPRAPEVIAILLPHRSPVPCR